MTNPVSSVFVVHDPSFSMYGILASSIMSVSDSIMILTVL